LLSKPVEPPQRALREAAYIGSRTVLPPEEAFSEKSREKSGEAMPWPQERRQVYCLFCETGRETQVEALMRKIGYEIIPSTAEYRVVKGGKQGREWRPILPGYVFFTAQTGPDWKKITGLDHVYYPLGYSDSTHALRGEDLDFVRWLLRRASGTGASGIGLSRVVRVGTKIKVVDGPLKDYEGSIVKVNLRRGCAAVEISTEGVVRRVWLGFEVMEGV